MSKRATSLFRAGLVAGVLLMAILAAAFGQTSSAATVPSLTIPDLIPADEGQPVVVPVIFDPGTATDVNLMQFDLRYDAQLLDLDPTDSDNNNIADSITVNVPSGFLVSVVDSVNGTTGSILVNLFNQSSPLAGLPAQTLLEITFTAAQVSNTVVTNINFATNPQPFFANKQGQVISGVFDGGSVEISGTAGPTPSATPSITPSPTITQTPSPTPTQGPLLRSFMPAVVYSFTPTPTATPVPPTLTPTPKPPTPTPKPPTPTPGPFCGELVLNGGMEDNSGWQININAYPASYVSGFAHSGARSMRIGIVNWWDNRYSYSSVQQSLTIPSSASNATLRFWLWPLTTGRSVDKLKPPAIVPTEFTDGTLAPLADDVQMVLLFDQAGTQHVLLFQRQNFGNWAYYEMNLDRFRGQRVTLYFGVFNNGTGGITSMYLDDVSLQFCN